LIPDCEKCNKISTNNKHKYQTLKCLKITSEYQLKQRKKVWQSEVMIHDKRQTVSPTLQPMKGEREGGSFKTT